MFFRKKTDDQSYLIAYADPRSPATEAYRTLRTNIQYFSLDKPVKTLLITGANIGCGKTTTSANLAVTLAQSGFSVLLVDTDLRRPTLHKFFSAFNDQGLTNLLVDPSRELSALVYQSKMENLHLLPSGPLPPNPAELLATEKMSKMVQTFKSQYDYVIFDSPPVIPVTDAAILSRLVDATILVVDHKGVTRDAAAFALEQLNKVQAKVIGAIINNIPNQRSYYRYYYSYYYGDTDVRRRRKRVRSKKRSRKREPYDLTRTDFIKRGEG